MSYTVTYNSQLTAVETLTGDFVSSNDNTVSINGLNTTDVATASTTPAVTKVAAYSVTMTSGAATINLAALTGLTSEETVNGTGLKVEYFKFRNKPTNANNITIAAGASNGYNIFGASGQVTIPPGAEIMVKGNVGMGTIGSGARTIDISGTGSQVLQIEIAMG